MPGPGLLLTSILLPAAVAAVVMLLLGHRRGEWGAAAGLTLGYLAGEFAHRGVPGFPPAEATQWAPIVVVAACVAAVVAAALAVPDSVRWGGRAVLAAGALVLLLRPLVAHTWTPSQSAIWIAGLTVAALVQRGLLGSFVPDQDRGRGFLPLAALAGCSAAAVAASGSLALGLATGGLAAAALGGASVAALRAGRALGPASLTPVWIALSFLIVAAATYSSLPWWSAALLAAAPAAVRVVPEARLSGRPWWVAEGLRGAAVAAVGVIAIAVAAWLSYTPASDLPY